MKWRKKGLIFSPDTHIWWQQHYGILPTPVYLEDKDRIRIFFASTCKDRFGRLSFIEVDANDPTKVLYRHNNFILDIGELGSFDDCGINPSSVLKLEGKWLLYYAGYQKHFRTPYSILSGLAISLNGVEFSRYKKVPILERTDSELSLRSAPTVIVDDNLFKMWYVSDYGWRKMETPLFKGKLMPLYCIKYGTSFNGIDWEVQEEAVLKPQEDEFGFGRPFIVKRENDYQLFYSIRRENTTYRIGYAESVDGITWIRKDKEVGIDVSNDGWDSEMICYPAIINVKGKTYLFYNGNNNGETGFGVAELIEE